MARGANTNPQPYVLDSDRELPVCEQTTFWIRCKNTSMGNATLQRYTRAQRQTGDGVSEYDSRKLQRADKEDFIDFCTKVENYAWSDEYMESHTNIETNDDGFMIQPIDDPEMLSDVVGDLSVSDFNELAAASNNQVRLSRGAKKN